MIDDPETALREALSTVEDAFAANELAYLAATSKVEHPFRDRLAFLLHQRLEPAGIMVAREWQRIDLALLRADGVPRCLVELKAMYTFDALDNRLGFYADAMIADEAKARRSAAPGTAIFTLLLATHFEGPVDVRFAGIVKYHVGINNAHARHGAGVRERAHEAIHRRLDASVAACGIIRGGRAFGAAVDVHYWLVRAASGVASTAFS